MAILVRQKMPEDTPESEPDQNPRKLQRVTIDLERGLTHDPRTAPPNLASQDAHCRCASTPLDALEAGGEHAELWEQWIRGRRARRRAAANDTPEVESTGLNPQQGHLEIRAQAAQATAVALGPSLALLTEYLVNEYLAEDKENAKIADIYTELNGYWLAAAAETAQWIETGELPAKLS